MRISNPVAATALAGIVFVFNPLWAQTMPPKDAPAQEQRSQTWSGTLADADCRAATPTEKCEVSDITKNFGLLTTAGKFVKLDNDGNEKVRAALEASKQKTGAIKASVNGTMDGEILKVESIQIR